MKAERIEILKKALELGKIRVDCENGIVYGPKGKRGIFDGNYLGLTIRLEKNYSFKVHEIVAYVGGLDVIDKDINHINGDKLDNRLCNLETVTHKINIRHARNAGLLPSGEKAHKAKLTKAQVDKIRNIYAEGILSQAEIARRFGISPSQVNHIIKNKNWKPVQEAM